MEDKALEEGLIDKRGKRKQEDELTEVEILKRKLKQSEAEKEDIETDYTKKDYEQAVAYAIDYWSLVYPYESNWVRDFEETCCDKPSWKYKTAMIQKKNSILPSSEFKKRKYAQLMSGYVLAEEPGTVPR